MKSPPPTVRKGLETQSSGPETFEDFPSLKKSLSAHFSNRSQRPPARHNVSSENGKAEMLRRPKPNPSSSSLSVDIPKLPSAADAAFSALQYLPTPLMVLSTNKTIVLVNEAMERLLGLDSLEELNHSSGEEGQESAPVTDMLLGQSLSQIGVDMVQDGQPIWVSWEKFLDELADEMETNTSQTKENVVRSDRDNRTRERNMVTETFKNPSHSAKVPSIDKKQPSSRIRSRALVHDAVVNVVLSSQYIGAGSCYPSRSPMSSSTDTQTDAKMIISIWTMENQRYFTLTFTSTSTTTISTNRPHPRAISRSSTQGTLSPSSLSTPSSPTSPSFCANCGSSRGFTLTTPAGIPLSLSPFPPLGAPGKSNVALSPSVLQKTSRMKDAIINAMEIPVLAMWRDESLGIPNKAASKLMQQIADPISEDAYDLLSRFKVYTEDFQRELKVEEHPIIKLCRTQTPFTKCKIGLLDSKSKRRHYDVSGEGIFDEKTGEFLFAIVTLQDVTEYTDIIKTQSEENDQQFQLICDTMPQMLWTTTPEGLHDWFSRRWYDYTGLSVQQSLGLGWQNPFHSDDTPQAQKKWSHSLATGDEYSVEYRCRRYDGAWRWMLGRALPLKDHKTGKIVKWFGTCTDIHDLVEARLAAKRTREQLLNVIKHAQVTVWAVDSNRILTFLEGKLMWDDDEEDITPDSVGMRVSDVFGKHHGEVDLPLYMDPINEILEGRTREMVHEHHIDGNGRWFRTRFVPTLGKKRHGGTEDESYVDGVIGVSMDVTELKGREAELQSQEQENIRLLSAETAAKEASRLKSQFLANMSHEIRTPIAGVIGMSELLTDTNLDLEQREFAENIQRSANGLLTVINDILDLSKVESGRLDIEEVHFSLSVVIHDVCKMLSFAAERKNLTFESDVQIGADEDLIVMGDPGRVRQILTNLLTNSIKFTSEGFVRLAVKAKKETSENIEVLFAVEDTGIGIEEEVRKRLFKPFSQADSSTARRFGGTGLGLTICKNVSF